MKRKTQKSNKNKLIILAMIIVALLVTGLVIYFVFIEGSFASKDDQTKTAESVRQDQGTGSDVASGEKNASLPVTEPDKDILHDQPSTGDDLGVWVTLVDIVGGTLRIRIQIDQNIGDGTCTLSIGDYTESVPVVANPQSASCKGFDVPTSAYSGSEFSILVKSGSKTGWVGGKINGY